MEKRSRKRGMVVMNKNELITIGWCDPGTVDGKFAEGVMATALQNKDKIVNMIRANGNQIGRQREVLIDGWYKNGNTDWLLWVDSDIVLTSDILNKLISIADKKEKPVVTGVYFISKENEQTMMMPMPCIFMDGEKANEMYYVHPLPENEVIKIDIAGMGLVMMHRDVVTKLKKELNEGPLFAEVADVGDKFISEDVVFFRHLKNAGIPVYAHTGARAQHIKRFSFDENFYSVYWHYSQMMQQQKENNG
jgi:GT2 family glycosyltransferase